jgi:hypothetical protein
LACCKVLDACDGQIYVVEQVSKFVQEHTSSKSILRAFWHASSHFHPIFPIGHHMQSRVPHKGTNFGLKEHAAAVLPSQKNDVAAKNLFLQLSMKGAQLQSESTYMARSQSLWSESPTAHHLATLAESILSGTFPRAHHCMACRRALHSWEVHCVEDYDHALETDRNYVDKNSPMPNFMRSMVVFF